MWKQRVSGKSGQFCIEQLGSLSTSKMQPASERVQTGLSHWSSCMIFCTRGFIEVIKCSLHEMRSSATIKTMLLLTDRQSSCSRQHFGKNMSLYAVLLMDERKHRIIQFDDIHNTKLFSNFSQSYRLHDIIERWSFTNKKY